MSRRCALVIGNSEYEDSTLSQLKTPEADVRALASALRDPNLGGFDDVEELINQPEAVVSRAISTFFAQKKPDDLLMLYFSGHGVLDPQGRLFLAVKDTQRNLLNATAIPASFVTDDMDSCRSKRQLLILDCCHSGAFARGSKGDSVAVTKSTFEGNGYGRVVLTASDSTQYALEGDQVVEQAALSLFTHYLMEGLTTGAADSAQDGWITLDEWYDYAYERVVSETPDQTPRKWVYNQQGELVIARNPAPKKQEPKDLPQELQDAIASRFVAVRQEALQELKRIVTGNKPALHSAAIQALKQLAEHDDSRQVSTAAAELLAEYKKLHPEGPEAASAVDLTEFPEKTADAVDQEALDRQGRERQAREQDERAKAEARARERAESEARAREKLENEQKQAAAVQPEPVQPAQFVCILQPAQVKAGQTALLTVTNRSNQVPGSYSLAFQDLAGGLEFTSSQPFLQASPGQSASIQFRVQPRSPRWFGGEQRRPFAVQVKDQLGAIQVATGEVITEASPIPLPVWAGGLGFLAVVCLILGFFALNNVVRNTGAARATSTAAAKDNQVAELVVPAALALTSTAAAATENAAVIPEAVITDTPPPNKATATIGIVLVAATPTAPATTVAPPPQPTAIPGRLAFSSNRDGNYNIFTMKIDGSDVQRLTKDPADDGYPMWSPDGSRILFHSDRTGNYDIYVMNIDGGNVVNLTGNSRQAETFAVWSPDGKRIAFQSKRNGYKQIYVMNADGSNQVALTSNDNKTDDSLPSWSPDGKQIIFISDRNKISTLFVMSTDGSHQTQVFSGRNYQSDPSWSPDGKSVIYVEWAEGTGKQIATYTLAQTSIFVAPIIKEEGDYAHPQYSPDGRYIYFESSRGGSSDIFRYSVRDGGIEQITKDAASDGEPSVW